MGVVRARVSSALKEGLYRSGALSLSRRCLGRSVALILRYHSVGADTGSLPAYLDPSLSVPLRAFDRQMRFLREHYTPLSLDQLVEAIAGNGPVPARAAVVTFDDGYRDNYVNAFVILKKYGIPATFYITAGCVNGNEVLWTSKLRYHFMATRERSLRLERPQPKTLALSSIVDRHASFAYTVALIKTLGKRRGDEILREVESQLNVTDFDPLRGLMLSWEEIQEMSRTGMTIGAHTLTHPNLPGLSANEAEVEIAGSKRLIEEKIQVPVRHFAYPNGRGVSHFNDAVKEIVRDAGFLSAVTSLNGPVRSGDDPLTLRRMGVYRKHSRISGIAFDMERARLDGASPRA